jgi:hypothetical protein
VDHVDEDRLGRLEAERRRVADVELQYPVALGLETLGLDQDRAAHVVADVLQLLALADPAHGLILSASPVLPRMVSAARTAQEAPWLAKSSG